MATQIKNKSQRNQVDFSVAILLVDIRFTNVDEVKIHIKAGTRIVVNVQHNIGCAGEDHFDVRPGDYSIDQCLAS